ncbi:hypothetical protein SAMD00019534_084910, partial [Acytostelium subglobosum LB1]|uniref:hypothetical protein n=1 Tax=Acytostelium subglobosum LB1 TaxID=1410327 RepID=UPI0006448FA0
QQLYIKQTMRSSIVLIVVLVVIPCSLAANYSPLATQTPVPTPPPCPCSDASLCEPLTTGPRPEFVGFSVSAENWDNYNMSSLTTIMKFGPDPSPLLICQAHAEGVRVTRAVDYDFTQIANQTYKEEWITDTVVRVLDGFYDGINLDFEYEIPTSEPFDAALLTALVTDVTLALKSVNPGYQISMDIPAAPCYYDRCYDYVGLGEAVDLLVVMDYDMNGGSLAGANSALPAIITGTTRYINLGVPSARIVMAFPWYGYNYQCTGNMTLDTRDCQPGSDVYDVHYDAIMALLNSTTNSGVQWDTPTESPYFNYEDGEQVRQVWFDNPKSIYAKAQEAKTLEVGGVGIWYLDCLNITTQAPMWQAIESFF